MFRGNKNLFDKAKVGDNASFDFLYKKYFNPVYRFLYFRLHDKALADEIAQITFTKAYLNRQKISDLENLLPYLLRIAKNAMVDHFRKEHHSKEVSENFLEEYTDNTADTKNFAKEEEAREVVMFGLSKLAEAEKEVIVLRFINELEYKEISKICGKSEEAIRQIVSRGLKKLKSVFIENNLI